MNNQQQEFPDLIKAGLKVGDKVHSYLYGDGVLLKIEDDPIGDFPLLILFNGGDYEIWFSKTGMEVHFQFCPSIHLQPWNPIAGEPFPFPKWEPIIGKVYAFWDTSATYYVTSRLVKINNHGYHTDWEAYEHCAPISEAMHIFGFDKVGEVKQ